MGFKKTFKKTAKKVKSVNKTVVAIATPVLSLASNLPSPYGETAKSAGDIVAMDAQAVSIGDTISGAISGGSSFGGSGGSSFGGSGSGGYASAPYSPPSAANKGNDSGGFFAWFFGLFGF